MSYWPELISPIAFSISACVKPSKEPTGNPPIFAVAFATASIPAPAVPAPTVPPGIVPPGIVPPGVE